MATGYDGKRRAYDASAFPLFGPAREMAGVVAVFWEHQRGRSHLTRRNSEHGAQSHDQVAQLPRYFGRIVCLVKSGTEAYRQSYARSRTPRQPGASMSGPLHPFWAAHTRNGQNTPHDLELGGCGQTA